MFFMLRDIFGQAMEAMRHNLRRTAITILGMAWGIATVVLLLAYGAGFGRAFEAIFAQFGTNEIGVFPGTTSEQAGGAKAGVQVRFQMDDVERIQETVPGVIHVAPDRLEAGAGTERSPHLHLGGRRHHSRAADHPEHERRQRAAFSHCRRHAAARPRRRHRLRGQDQALLRRVSPSARPSDSTASASR